MIEAEEKANNQTGSTLFHNGHMLYAWMHEACATGAVVQAAADLLGAAMSTFITRGKHGGQGYTREAWGAGVALPNTCCRLTRDCYTSIERGAAAVFRLPRFSTV